MSASVGSASMRSSCRCKRSSSPESCTPPSSGVERSRLSRSRSRSSCSDGGIEQPQELGEQRADLRARQKRVGIGGTAILLGEPEIVGPLLARRLLYDPRPGKRDQRSRLGEKHVPERRKAREHPG